MSAKVLRIFLFVFFNDQRILDPTFMPFKKKKKFNQENADI